MCNDSRTSARTESAEGRRAISKAKVVLLYSESTVEFLLLDDRVSYIGYLGRTELNVGFID